MSTAEIVQRLDAKRNGEGWQAKCPAHDDRSPKQQGLFDRLCVAHLDRRAQ